MRKQLSKPERITHIPVRACIKGTAGCQRKHGDNWEAAFRAKLGQDLPSKDLMFLLGTIHRFPHQWLLISLIYPLKPPAENPKQAGLF